MGTTFPDGKPAAPSKLDRPVLVSNLVSGVLWLLVLAALGSWVLALIGAAYVAVASVFLSAFYARDSLAARQEIVAWVGSWLVAVALWVWVGAGVDGDGSWLLSLWFGLALGTGCYLAWQLLALAVRRLLTSAGRMEKDSRLR